MGYRMKGSTFFNKSALKQLGDDEKQLIKDLGDVAGETGAGLGSAYALDKATKGTVINPKLPRNVRGRGIKNFLKWGIKGIGRFARRTPVAIAGWEIGATLWRNRKDLFEELKTGTESKKVLKRRYERSKSGSDYITPKY